MIDKQTLIPHFENFSHKKPFSYAVVDHFFPTELANQLSSEFPDFDDSKWDNVKISESPGGKLEKAFFPPVQILKEIVPIKIYSQGKKKWIV